MQKFQYVNDYDLKHMNVFESTFRGIQNITSLQWLFYILCFVFLAGVVTLVLGAFAKNDNTLLETGAGLIIIAIAIIAFEGYYINKNVNYLGHYETKGKITSVEQTSTENKYKVGVKVNKKQPVIEADIEDKSKVEKGDDVFVKTGLLSLKKRPPKETTNLGLATGGINIKAEKR